MEIIAAKAQKCKKNLKLNIGCGSAVKKGWVNIDTNYAEGMDIIRDVNYGLPFCEQSCQKIVAEHLIEHLDNPVQFMNECFRVLQPGGTLLFKTPHITHQNSWIDHTHKFHFVERSFDFHMVLDQNSLNAGVAGWFGESSATHIGGELTFKFRKLKNKELCRHCNDVVLEQGNPCYLIFDERLTESYKICNGCHEIAKKEQEESQKKEDIKKEMDGEKV